ncbi:MAG: hypothetical protein KF832_25745 [Caldilineaceae bacterium]|nr:hypothetical protein [Caldilineaceae bacterium]
MQNQVNLPPNHPFPATRPDIRVVERDQPMEAIECLELQWWFAIPRLQERTMSAFYEIDTLHLAAVNDLVAVRPARVDQAECVEIQVDVWTSHADWPTQPSQFYSRIDDTRTGWVAVATQNQGQTVLNTYHDPHFANNWGMNGPRWLYDDGRYQRQPDGSYQITNGQGLGAGTYEVTIGERSFLCLRVIDVGIPSEVDELGEAFITREGRTVLYRQYQGRLWGSVANDRVQLYPHNRRLVINDCIYVHCNCSGRAHDVITNTAVGVAL